MSNGLVMSTDNMSRASSVFLPWYHSCCVAKSHLIAVAIYMQISQSMCSLARSVHRSNEHASLKGLHSIPMPSLHYLSKLMDFCRIDDAGNRFVTLLNTFYSKLIYCRKSTRNRVLFLNVFFLR